MLSWTLFVLMAVSNSRTEMGGNDHKGRDELQKGWPLGSWLIIQPEAYVEVWLRRMSSRSCRHEKEVINGGDCSSQ